MCYISDLCTLGSPIKGIPELTPLSYNLAATSFTDVYDDTLQLTCSGTAGCQLTCIKGVWESSCSDLNEMNNCRSKFE